MEIFIQTAGWVGTFLVVLAYFLISSKRIGANDKRYQIMNLLGAVGVGINVFYQEAWPSVALQVIWGVIAIVALLKMKESGSESR